MNASPLGNAWERRLSVSQQSVFLGISEEGTNQGREKREEEQVPHTLRSPSHSLGTYISPGAPPALMPLVLFFTRAGPVSFGAETSSLSNMRIVTQHAEMHLNWVERVGRGFACAFVYARAAIIKQQSLSGLLIKV